MPISDAIGNTPLADLGPALLLPAGRVFGKLEWCNPGGSVKDRTALGLARDGVARYGSLQGREVAEATSGNTGVALALLAPEFGYGLHVFMPSTASEPRKALLEAHGATVHLTDPLEGQDGAIEACQAFVKDRGAIHLDQYNNQANPRIHEATTAVELWNQTQGRVTHVVGGVGTGGTITGIGRALRPRGVRVVGVHPAEPLNGLEGLKHLPTSIVPTTYDPAAVDEHVDVPTVEAWNVARQLIRGGFPVGPSAGAATLAARRVAEADPRAVVAAILPDGLLRYLGTPFARHVQVAP